MIQPPRVGPTIGATTTPMPNSGHRRAALGRREALHQDRLRERLQRAAARPLRDAAEDQQPDGRRGAAERSEASVNSATQAIRNRLRPNQC